MITRFIFSFIAGVVNFALGTAIMGGLIVFSVVLHMTRELPSYEELRQYNPPTISRVYDGSGQIIDEFAQERRIFASIQEIPHLLREAVISAEDKNFYTHQGFDLRAMGLALYEAIESRGEDVRGASTITQQVMKNFLLTPDRTIERKVQEIVLANRVEQAFTKDEILELYLNEIFFGQNAYGVAAAALTYFNKSLNDLTLHEAAYLAALPQQPANLHPVRNYDAALSRRNYVLDQMWRNGYIERAAFEDAVATPLHTVQSGHYPAYRDAFPPRDYATEEVRRQLLATMGEDIVYQGGLQIEVTYDPRLQVAARDALRNGLLRLDSAAGIWRPTGFMAMPADTTDDRAWAAALRSLPLVRDMEGWFPATVIRVEAAGAFVAVEQGERVRIGVVPPAQVREWSSVERDGQLTRARSLEDMMRPGEVIYVAAGEGTIQDRPVWHLRQVPKVEGGFLAIDVETGNVLAMQGGFSFDRSNFNRVTLAQRQTGSSFKPLLYAAAFEQGVTAASLFDDTPKTIRVGDQTWTPRNASGRSYGRVSVRTGMERSLNLLTLDLGQTIGLDATAEMAERLGVYERMARFPANMLGSQETTLWNMVRAYAVFASGGERVDISPIARIRNRHGDVLYEHNPLCESCAVSSKRHTRPQLMSPVTAYQMTDILQGVITSGTGSRIRLPVPVAGKTGTTNDARDVWFVGYTPRIVAGCFIGFDDPQPLGRGAGGGSVCGPVFEEFMQTALEHYPSEAFPVPEEGRFAYFANGREVPYQTSIREFVQGDGLASVPLESTMPTALPRTTQEPVSPQQQQRRNFESLGTGGLY